MSVTNQLRGSVRFVGYPEVGPDQFPEKSACAKPYQSRVALVRETHAKDEIAANLTGRSLFVAAYLSSTIIPAFPTNRVSHTEGSTIAEGSRTARDS
jgi:hypothetical protein